MSRRCVEYPEIRTRYPLVFTVRLFPITVSHKRGLNGFNHTYPPKHKDSDPSEGQQMEKDAIQVFQ